MQALVNTDGVAKMPLGRAAVEVYEHLGQHEMSVAGIAKTVAAAAALDEDMRMVTRAPEFVGGFAALDAAGVLPEVSLSTWTRAIDMKPEDKPPTQWPATFKDAEEHLLRCCVHHRSSNPTDHFRNDVDLESERVGVRSIVFFHGTIASAAYGIMKAGGFLPGSNGHTKGKRHYKGCFGSTNMDTAYYRGDPTRHLETDGVYSLASCPVILEFEASCMHIIRYNSRMRHCVCIPGLEGQLLPGLRLRAMWVNASIAHNYINLTWEPALRQEVIDCGGIVNACCGGHRQMLDFQSCGKIVRSPWLCPGSVMTPSTVIGQKVGKYLMCSCCARQWGGR